MKGVMNGDRSGVEEETREQGSGMGEESGVVMELCATILCAGGAGTYVVLQCGSAGHNIRSKPTLQGSPVGRLKLGDTFQVEDEVSGHGTV